MKTPENNNPENTPNKPEETLNNTEGFLSKSGRKILLYFLLGSGAITAGSNPRLTETLGLTVPGIHELYESGSLNEDEKKVAKEIKEELGEIAGNLALSMIETGKSVSSREEREEILSKEPNKLVKVEGFNKIDIPNEYIQDIIRETLPKGSQMQISGVTYGTSSLEKEEIDLYEKVAYQRKEKGSVVAITNPISHKITFLRVPESKKNKRITKANIIAGYLLHEQGHASDWNSNTLMTRKEKMELFLSILKRLDASDKLKSPQITSIESYGEIGKYVQAHEYFAEINRIYLDEPRSEGKNLLSDSDTEIVSIFYKMMDPGFNQQDARNRRNKLITGQHLLDLANEHTKTKNFADTHYRPIFESIMNKIPSGKNISFEQLLDNIGKGQFDLSFFVLKDDIEHTFGKDSLNLLTLLGTLRKKEDNNKLEVMINKFFSEDDVSKREKTKKEIDEFIEKADKTNHK